MKEKSQDAIRTRQAPLPSSLEQQHSIMSNWRLEI